MEPKQLTAEAIQQFQQGVSLIFEKWYALNLAIENSWGGPHSRDIALGLASRVFNFFHQPNRKEPLYIDDLEDLLDEGMDSLNTTAEDGSIEEVAEQLMIMYEECVEGNYQSIERLRGVQTAPVQAAPANDSDEEDDEILQNDVASSMMVDPPKPGPTPGPTDIAKTGSSSQNQAEEDDGWVTVSSRSRGRRK